MSSPSFRLIAPPVTPFDAQGCLYLGVVEQQAQLLQRTGVDGVFVAGTTGECTSLTLEERLALAERWVEVTRQTELEVIIQAGDNCQANAIRLAAHAQQIGATATAAFSPHYFRPADVESLIEFLAPVAAAAGDLPFYFYDIPPTTNVRLPMVEFLEKAKPKIPNLVGLKYSNQDLVQMQECQRFQEGEFELLFGCDEILLAGLAIGVQGAIGSTYNFAAPLYRRMVAAFEAGDLPTARSCQLKSLDIINALLKFGFMASCKEVLSMLGVDCGPVRPPFRNLTDEQRHQLRQSLEQFEIRQFARRELPNLAPSRT